MINNNTDLTRKAAELLHRLETGEIDIKMAKQLSNLITNVQKGYIIDIMKTKMKIEKLPSEETIKRMPERSDFVKKVS